MSGMGYKKCKDCEHKDKYYAFGGGLRIVCWITGDTLKIDKCPKERKCECESCKHGN